MSNIVITAHVWNAISENAWARSHNCEFLGYKSFNPKTLTIALIPVIKEYVSSNIRGKGLILELCELFNY